MVELKLFWDGVESENSKTSMNLELSLNEYPPALLIHKTLCHFQNTAVSLFNLKRILMSKRKDDSWEILR